MATRANKITIRVTPARHQQVMSVHATGKFGSKTLSFGPIYQQGQALSSASDTKTYWNAVLVLATAMVLSM